MIVQIALVSRLHSQSSHNEGCRGEFHHEDGLCLSEEMREEIIRTNITNIRKLKLDTQVSNNSRMLVLLDWPLRQANEFQDNDYYLITNFVDQNPASGSVRDYNCGTRTYDGHKGTDIVIWPFMWHKMNVNQVEVIAAQPGVIINKSDGNFDMNCQWVGTGNWNAVYIRHSDGSVAWYGHLKKGSLTTKSIGQSVSKGEYLGLVGSSGMSSAPHLHFELYSNSTQTDLIDPFAGNCNTISGNTSWWSNQKPYYDPRLLNIMVHDCNSISQPDGCPANNYNICENYYIKSGTKATFSAHFRQQNNTLTASYTIRKPDNTIWKTWNSKPTTTYTYGSWWWWSYDIPTNGPYGTWYYEVTYNGEKVSKPFVVENITSTNETKYLSSFNIFPNPASNIIYLNVDFVNKEKVTLEINNNLGHSFILNQYENNISDIIDISNLPGGVYQLVLTGSEFKIARRVVVIR